MKDRKKEDKSIEEMLDDIDGIIEKLERGDTSLEEGFKLYEAGVRMVSSVNERIDRVEKRTALLDEQMYGSLDEDPGDDEFGDDEDPDDDEDLDDDEDPGDDEYFGADEKSDEDDDSDEDEDDGDDDYLPFD